MTRQLYVFFYMIWYFFIVLLFLQAVFYVTQCRHEVVERTTTKYVHPKRSVSINLN